MTPDHEPDALREQKLVLGEELFDYACTITMAGIRNQFPEADEPEQRRILDRRLEYQRKLEERLCPA